MDRKITDSPSEHYMSFLDTDVYSEIVSKFPSILDCSTFEEGDVLYWSVVDSYSESLLKEHADEYLSRLPTGTIGLTVYPGDRYYFSLSSLGDYYIRGNVALKIYRNLEDNSINIRGLVY